MADFVCMGDATIDNFFFIDDASVHCNLLKENCMLELKYGQKISVSKFGTSLGGNAANVSVGLSRLGVRTALMTTFGDDERGAWIKKKLMENNVDICSCKNDSKIQSNISSIIIFKGERTILSYHGTDNLISGSDKVPPCQWLYLTSGTDCPEISGAKLAFNPWMKDIRENLPAVKRVLEKTDVLLVNKEEAEALGVLGPKITVITDGKNGVTAYIGDQIIKKPAIGEKALEPTGAGDAFSSGFLAGLYYGKDLETAMDWGLKNAGSVIQKIGAIEGLLRKNEIS